MEPPKSTANPNLVGDDATVNEAAIDTTAAAPASTDAASGNLLADSFEQGKAMLNEHKGKLAIGVAATLGLMVFYKWREKKLAEEDPEEYARLQRIKAVVREQEGTGAADRDEDD